MKMKMPVLVAVVAIAAVMCIGVGYAFSLYYESSQNAPQASYVVITHTGDGYSFTNEDTEIPLASLIRQDGKHYGISGAVTIENSVMGSYTCANLGKIQFHAELTGNDDYPDLSVQVRSSSNFDGTSTWVYLLTDGAGKIYAYKDTSSADGAWKKGPDTLIITSTAAGGTRSYSDETVYVCYGFSDSDSIAVDGVRYVKTTERPKPLVDASLVFRASDSISYSISYLANDPDSTGLPYIDSAMAGSYSVKQFEATGLSAPDGKTFAGWSRTAGGNVISGDVALEGDIAFYAKYNSTA